MTKRLMAVGLAVVMLFSAVALVGCGTRTAADYLNAHSQADLDAIVAQVRAMGMDIEMTTDGDTMIYTYTFMEQLDADDFDASMMEAMLRPTADMILAEMSDFGVANPEVRYIYLNADGAVLADMTFTL